MVSYMEIAWSGYEIAPLERRNAFRAWVLFSVAPPELGYISNSHHGLRLGLHDVAALAAGTVCLQAIVYPDIHLQLLTDSANVSVQKRRLQHFTTIASCSEDDLPGGLE